MNIGLRHLQFFVAAAQHGSFRRAAEIMKVRQSTLSRAIQQLECQLNVILFVRSTSGVRLTLIGAEFVKTAKRLLGDFEALVSMAEASSRGKRGRLLIGSPTSIAVIQLAPALLEYATRFPEIDIRLAGRSKSALLADLRANALDLAVVVGDVEELDLDRLTLWSERIFVAVPQSHPLATRTFVYWTDLGDQILLLSRHGLGPELREIMASKLASGGKLPRVEDHAIGSEALLSLVAAGRGVALQCEGTVRIPYSGLIQLEVHDGTGTSWMTYSGCWRKQHTNPALVSFLPLLRAHRSAFSTCPRPDT